ncbi:MAG TPA: hypothetical protein VHR46_02920 [Gaiella sp.]|nr:hypothetical protein [Gaiella sp.]
MPNRPPLSVSGRRQWGVRAGALVAVLVSSGILAGAAWAQGEPPTPSSSAVSQYAELLPTGAGPTAAGVKEQERGALSAKAQRALARMPDTTAKALATIATSSDYSAPTATRDRGSTSPGEATPGQRVSLDRTFQAAASAASPVGDAYLVGLVVALLVVTIGGAGLAVRARGA